MNIVSNSIYTIVMMVMQIEHSSQFVKARRPGQVVVYLVQNLRLSCVPHQ